MEIDSKELILIGEYFHNWREIVRPDLWLKFYLEKKSLQLRKVIPFVAGLFIKFSEIWEEIKKDKEE